MLDAIAAEHGDAPVDALAISLGVGVPRARGGRAAGALPRPGPGHPHRLQQASGLLRGPPEAPARCRASTASSPSRCGARPSTTCYVSRPSIRYFLQQDLRLKEIDEGLLDYDYLTTHQPGAKNAPYAFVSGRLFSSDIRERLRALTLPVWMPHGTRGDFQDFSEAGWARGRPGWAVETFDTGALPHFERPQEFIARYRAFLQLDKSAKG